MNVDELHDALDAIAGPTAVPTAEVRASVARRVRRTRRRTAIASGAVALLVAIVVGAGVLELVVRSGTAEQVDVVVASGSGKCRRLPRAVPRHEVPPEVRRWAEGASVVGGGSLWTIRPLLDGTAAREGSVVRLKIGWFVVPADPGGVAPVLTARRLGGAGRATGSAQPATSASGTWFASTIELPTSTGCWEITARHGDDVIRFRRRVGGST